MLMRYVVLVLFLSSMNLYSMEYDDHGWLDDGGNLKHELLETKDVSALQSARLALPDSQESLASYAIQRGDTAAFMILAGRQAIDGFLPHQPVQAAGEQWARFPAIG